jgi:hypothetical protein
MAHPDAFVAVGLSWGQAIFTRIESTWPMRCTMPVTAPAVTLVA